MERHFSHRFSSTGTALFLAAAAVVFAATGAAADDNTLFLRQQSLSGVAEGNTIFIDQSLATGAVVAGDLAAQTPAQQVGNGNSGEITIAGTDSTVIFTQGTVANPAFSNTALVDILASGALASLTQTGTGNTGTLSLAGLGVEGSLAQIGDNNDAQLFVTGTGASGALSQTGNDNTTVLTVTGNGTNVTYEVIGDGVTALVDPSVVSNGGSITIRQFAVGGP